MSFVAVAIGGSALVGAAASISAARTQASAINASTAATTRAADEQVRFAEQARDIATQELAPYADTGAQANDAVAKLLGLSGAGGGGGGAVRPAAQPGGASSGSPGARPGSPDWTAYAQDPGIKAEYERSRTGKGAGVFSSLEDYAQWHYENYGRAEGRALPTVAAPPQTQAQPVEATTQQAPNQPAQPAYSGIATNTNPAAAGFEATPFGTMAQDAQATFENSPWNSIANDEIDTAIGNLDGKYGASGLMLSGGALRARAEIASRLRGENFDKHYAARSGNFADFFNALDGTRATGMTAASGIGNAGANFADAAGSARVGAANTSANAAVAAAGARQQGVSDAVGFGGYALGQYVGSRAPKAITPVSTYSFPSLPPSGVSGAPIRL